MPSRDLRKLWTGLRSGVRGIIRTPLAFGLSVVTIGAGLLLLSAYLLLLDNMRAVLEEHGRGLAVVAFLEPGAEPADRGAADLEVRLVAIDGVERARFVSRAQALERLRETLGDDASVLEGLEQNPLPASFELEVAEASRTPDGMRALAAAIGGVTGVAEVRYGEGWVEGYTRILRALQWVGLGFGACLALVLGVIVAGTVRLALHARSDEIQIQRLVGASGFFVRLPLYVEAAVQGALGAALALVVLWTVVALGRGLIAEPLALLLGATPPSFFGMLEVVALLVLGTVLGVGSAALSLVRLEGAR